MRFTVAAIALTLSTLPAFAALSGFYDSGEQIGLIIANSEIGDALRQAPIDQISRTGTRADGAHEWTIKAQECSLKVYLVPEPPQGLGKTTYKLEVAGSC